MFNKEIIQLQEGRSRLRVALKEPQRQRQKRALWRSSSDWNPIPRIFWMITSADLEEWADVYLACRFSRKAGGYRSCFRFIPRGEIRLGRSADFAGAVITSSQVIAGTCVGIGAREGDAKQEFDLCIVDEASKATPTGNSRSNVQSSAVDYRGRQLKQLPPFVEDGVDPQLLAAHGAKYRKCLARPSLTALEEQLPKESITTLNTQHRMVPPIGRPDKRVLLRFVPPKRPKSVGGFAELHIAKACDMVHHIRVNYPFGCGQE